MKRREREKRTLQIWFLQQFGPAAAASIVVTVEALISQEKNNIMEPISELDHFRHKKITTLARLPAF
jgi:hypothetical protein